MKILMVNKADRIGGAAEIAWSLKVGLENTGHDVEMFVADKTTKDDQVHSIPRPKWLFYLSHLLGTDIDLFQTDYILGTPEFKNADLVHLHNIHGHYFNLKTLLKMSQLKPVVWTLHDMWAVTPYCSHSFVDVDASGFYACQKNSSKSVCKRRNHSALSGKKAIIYQQLQVNLVVPSLWLQNKVSKSILNNKNIHLIHNGIRIINQVDAGRREELRLKLNLPLDKKIVLFVASGGKDNIWKGWSYAQSVIEKLSTNEDLMFICIGGKGVNAKNLLFVDYLSDEMLMSEYYACANAFMLTSVAESFGLVVLEAMSAGLPVVSFEVGIVNEVIKHKVNGYIAKYLDVDDFVKGIEYVLSDHNLNRAEMVLDNKKLITERYSNEVMLDNYLRLYRQCLERK